MKKMIIKNTDFERVVEGLKPDAKKRVMLRRIDLPEGVTYHMYRNSHGQILLDPQVSIPASEAWLFNNPQALALVQQGLAEAKQGKVSKIDLKNL
jgi:hypothetical protein